MALLAEEQATHVCGHLIAESFDPATEGAYVAEPRKCNACAALAKERTRAADPENAADLDGMILVVHKKEEPKHD